MSDIQTAIILDALATDLVTELEVAEGAIVSPGNGDLIGEIIQGDDGVHRYALPLVGLWEIVKQMEGYIAWLRGGEGSGVGAHK